MNENSPPSPPPPASAFLQKHTHHSDNAGDEAASSVNVGGATEIVSNLFEGLIGAATGEDDSSSRVSGSPSSMKHRKGSPLPYDQRLPKTYDTDGQEIPYRGFAKAPGVASSDQEAPARPARLAKLRHSLRGLFSPRATDIQQLLVKLQTQFQVLELDFQKYALDNDGSMWDEGMQNTSTARYNSRKDPNHPLNNPKLMTEIHFVGRNAIDPSIVNLSSLLMNHDKFGSITELWLNDNLISNDGAAAIAKFLQLPTCVLVEVWLGNNQIGPTGTALISAALSNNEHSHMKCLGLYKNPIGNGGASTLAQMLRRNHTLSTVAVHGCGNRDKGHEVLEGYGCKVIKAIDGTEYVAKVVAADMANMDSSEGIVTDQRLLDAIQTFVAFNRLNPTREQAIRGMMSSSKHIQDEAFDKEGDDTRDHKTSVSKFLSHLCSQPANEQMTDEEKQTWKSCEWERLHVELERARATKAALANRLKILAHKNEGKLAEKSATGEEEATMEQSVESDRLVEDRKVKMIARDLDDEIVKTDTRSWRDLKMGITGSAKANSQEKEAPTSEQQFTII